MQEFPLIITRTPLRVSLLGGGTDYPEYFNEHGGVVLATSIDKYCYVGVSKGQMWTHSDLPVRSGMATSSAFTVGLLKACTDKPNEEIAGLATIWERDKLDDHVGYQDQYICAVGGFHRLRFYASGIVDEPVGYSWLEPYLMLFDTGQYRKAGEVVEHQLARIDENQEVLHRLKMLAIRDYKSYRDFGLAMGEAWALKKELADDVTTPFTDEIYDKALRAGAIGGKLLGAGGGGVILLVVEPKKQAEVSDAMKLKHVPFKFDKSGSQVIYEDS